MEWIMRNRQKGFTLVGSSELPGPIHELIMDKPDVGARQMMRIWYGSEGVYRAMATTEKGHHDDPRASGFVSSFRITAASPEK